MDTGTFPTQLYHISATGAWISLSSSLSSNILIGKGKAIVLMYCHVVKMKRKRKQVQPLLIWKALSIISALHLKMRLRYSITYYWAACDILYPLSFQEVCTHQASSHPKRSIFRIWGPGENVCTNTAGLNVLK